MFNVSISQEYLRKNKLLLCEICITFCLKQHQLILTYLNFDFLYLETHFSGVNDLDWLNNKEVTKSSRKLQNIKKSIPFLVTKSVIAQHFLRQNNIATKPTNHLHAQNSRTNNTIKPLQLHPQQHCHHILTYIGDPTISHLLRHCSCNKYVLFTVITKYSD